MGVAEDRFDELDMVRRLDLDAADKLFIAAKERELAAARDWESVDEARRYLRQLEDIIAEKHADRQQI